MFSGRRSIHLCSCIVTIILSATWSSRPTVFEGNHVKGLIDNWVIKSRNRTKTSTSPRASPAEECNDLVETKKLEFSGSSIIIEPEPVPINRATLKVITGFGIKKDSEGPLRMKVEAWFNTTWGHGKFLEIGPVSACEIFGIFTCEQLMITVFEQFSCGECIVEEGEYYTGAITLALPAIKTLPGGFLEVKGRFLFMDDEEYIGCVQKRVLFVD